MAAIPTQYVRVKATAHEQVINVMDFDPAIHEAIDGPTHEPEPLATSDDAPGVEAIDDDGDAPDIEPIAPAPKGKAKAPKGKAT